MLENEMPVKQTPYSYVEFHDAMKTAYYSEFGYDFNDVAIKICASQTIVETGWYDSKSKMIGKSCFNWNVGNIKGSSVLNGKACGFHMLRNVWEIENGKKVFYQPPHIQTHFKGYDSLLNGVTDYLLLLSRRKVVWTVLHDSQSPKDYVDALAAARYFTADKTQYYNLLNSIYKSL